MFLDISRIDKKPLADLSPFAKSCLSRRVFRRQSVEEVGNIGAEFIKSLELFVLVETNKCRISEEPGRKCFPLRNIGNTSHLARRQPDERK